MMFTKTIKSILRPIKHYYYVEKQEFAWRIQVRLWRRRLSPITSVYVPHDARILVLAPHSDDEWIGCSELIKGYRNTSIFNMDMNGGDSETLHVQRYFEMKNLADKFHRTVTTTTQDKSKSIIDAIYRFSPDYICVPHFFDWHPEHIQVIDYLREAISQSGYAGKIIMYQVSLPFVPADCNLAIAMSRKAHIEKWNIFKTLYPSQTKISYRRFMANERINGALADAYSAEVYHVTDVSIWMQDYQKMLLSSDETTCIKSNISNIDFVRSTLSVFWNKRQ